MDKSRLLSHLNLREDEQIQTVNKIIDLCERCGKSHQVVTSSFLPPIYMKMISEIMLQYRDLGHKIYGGYEESEYFKVMIFPEYLEPEMMGIKIIRGHYNTKYGTIGHRDVLGALMGLGIKRQLIGDILVSEGLIQIFSDEDMSDYISAQLNKIGRVSVTTEVVDLEDIDYEAPKFESISQTVSSLRLDSIVSSGYRISRSKAATEINSDKVKLNHVITASVSKMVEEGDLVSVRGRGRIVLESVLGLSKKDRMKIVIKKYI